MKKNIGLLLLALSLGTSSMVADDSSNAFTASLVGSTVGSTVGGLMTRSSGDGSAGDYFRSRLDQLEERLRNRFESLEARIRNLEKNAEGRSDLYRYKSQAEQREMYSKKRDKESEDSATVNDERTQKNLNWREKIRLHKRVQKARPSKAPVQLDESND